MKFVFEKAQTSQSRARVTLIGPSGSGKTFTALQIARGLGQRIAVIDTENGSASKYADHFDFHVLSLDEYSPQTYVKAIRAAEEAGFDVLIIDSLSHAWIGKGGALEMVNKAEKRYHGNSFAAWRDVTPLHNAMIDAIVQCGCHLIATMRAKTDYVIDTDDKGRKVPRKIGTAPVQRDGVEYEFDIVADLDLEHNMVIQKTRCHALDGAVFPKPGPRVGQIIRKWLEEPSQVQVDALVTAPVTPTQLDTAAPQAPVVEVKPARSGGAEAARTASRKAAVEVAPPAPVVEVEPEPEVEPEVEVAPVVEAAPEAAPEIEVVPTPKVDDLQAWKTAALNLKKTAQAHFNGDHDLVLEALKRKEGVEDSRAISTTRLQELAAELDALAAEGEPSKRAQLLIWKQMMSPQVDEGHGALLI